MAVGKLVASNVLLDVFTDNRTRADRSAEHYVRALDAGHVLINPLVHAELSVGFERIEDLRALLRGIERQDLPWKATLLAGASSSTAATAIAMLAPA